MKKFIALLLALVVILFLVSWTEKEVLLATPMPAGTSAAEVYDNVYEYMACLGYAECRGENLEGQISVFAVPINRVQHDGFPSTFFDVITEDNPRQFTPVGNDDLIYSNRKVVTFDMVPQKTLDALDRALAGEDPTERLLKEKAESLVAAGKKLKLDISEYYEGGAVFFMTKKAFSRFKNQVAVYVIIDHHVFFRAWSK